MKYLFTIIFVSSLLLTNAQVSITEDGLEHVAWLRKSTTLIPISKDIDPEVRRQYKEVFEKYWKISTPKIITPEELTQYDNSTEYSYLAPSYYFMQGDVNMYETFALDLYRYVPHSRKSKRKNGEVEQVNIGHIYMIPNHSDPELPLPRKESDMAPAFSYVYTTHYEKIENMSPGLMRAYINLLDYRLTRKLEREDDYVNKGQVRRLKKETLYVPNTAFYHTNSDVSEEKRNEVITKMFEDYPYPHQVVSMEELNEKLLNAEEPIYIMMYTLCSPWDNVAVIEVTTGTLVYEAFDSFARSHSLRDNDIEDIADEIK